jgi:hypothetical protein
MEVVMGRRSERDGAQEGIVSTMYLDEVSFSQRGRGLGCGEGVCKVVPKMYQLARVTDCKCRIISADSQVLFQGWYNV